MMSKKNMVRGNPEREGESRRIMSGAEAVLRSLSHYSESVVVVSDTMMNGVSLRIPAIEEKICYRERAAGSVAYAGGLAATGQTASVFIESNRLEGLTAQLQSATTRQVPLVVVISPSLSTATSLHQSGALRVMSIAHDSRCPTLVASTSQHLVDSIAVATILSREALFPVVVIAEGRETIWSIQPVDLPSVAADTAAFSHADAETAGPLSTYRRRLFGEEPAIWVDPVNPLAIGVDLSDDLALKVRAGRDVFLQRHTASVLDRVCDDFSRRTGRDYRRLHVTGPDSAEVVLIAAGAVAGQAERLVGDRSMKKNRIKVVRLACIRPFSDSDLIEAVGKARHVGVFVSSSESGLDELDLVRTVRSALLDSPPGPLSGRKGKKTIPSRRVVVPVLYAAGWQPTSGILATLVQRLSSTNRESRPFVVGTSLSASDVRAPEIERIRQHLAADGIDFASMEVLDKNAAPTSAQVITVTDSGDESWTLLEGLSTVLARTGKTLLQAGFHPISDASRHPVVGCVSWEQTEQSTCTVITTNSSLLNSLDVHNILPARCRKLLLTSSEADPGDHTDSYSAHDEGPLETFLSSVDGKLTDISDPCERSGDSRERVGKTPFGKPEDLPPLDIVEQPEGGTPVADLDRFWKTTGYLYRANRTKDVPADPFLTSTTLPARAGALTTHTAESDHFPSVLTENCSGCGCCWTVCPESAIVSRVFTVEQLFDSALKRAQDSGHAFVQVPRFKPALIKTMHRIVVRDDLIQYSRVGDLMTEAFTQMLDKAGLDEEKRALLVVERDWMLACSEAIQTIRTVTYFLDAESRKKGSGQLLSLAVDPAACTACGLCYASCGDDALESGSLDRHDPERLFSSVCDLRTDDITLDSIADLQHEMPHSLLLTGPTPDRVFRAGGADIGNLNRTVLRLFLEAQQAHSSCTLGQLSAGLASMIADIEKRIQKKVQDAVEINDFEAFSRSLTSTDQALDTDRLTRLAIRASGINRSEDLLTDLARDRDILSSWLKRLTPSDNIQRLPHMALIMAASERSFGLAPYPINPFAMPTVHSDYAHVPELAAGLDDGLTARYREIQHLLNRAGQIIKGVFDPSSIPTANAEDKDVNAPAVLIVTDHMESDLVNLLCSGRHVKVLLISGGPTPDRRRPDPLRLALPVSNLWIHQMTAADSNALFSAFVEGLAHDGPVLFHVYAPDPVRDGVALDSALQVAALAQTSGVFPELRRVPGTPIEICSEVQPDTRPADWLLAQTRFKHCFRFIPRREWSGDQIPIAEWTKLSPEKRDGKIAFAERSDAGGTEDARGRVSRFALKPAAITFTLDCERSFDEWTELASTRVTERSPDIVPPVKAAPPSRIDTGASSTVDTSALQTLSDRLLELSGFGGDS